MDQNSALELIEKSEHVALFLPPEPNLDCLVSAEVLNRALEEKGKRIGFLANVKLDRASSPELFEKIKSGRPLPKEFIISLDTSRAPVSQLRYEKGENNLDIILSPQDESLAKELLVFREGKQKCDLVISLGVRDLENENGPDSDPELFTQTPLINIDISPLNKNYGEVNLVNSRKSALAELVYELVVALREKPPEKEWATLILAALVQQTDSFSGGNSSADTLLAASELLRLGADGIMARDLARKIRTLDLLQLIGRASVRSRLDERGILWSFITAEDFEKTGRTPADTVEVMNHLETNFPPAKIRVLLWQNPEEKNIRAIFSGERRLLEILEGRGAGSFQSPYLALAASFKTFREAEESIALMLIEIIS